MSKFMTEALKEANKAFFKDEVPVGCVIVFNNKIIARAHNIKETTQLTTAHAEINAINKACKRLKTWRLENCTMYVTLEPCSMCAGAIIQSRIKELYFGAYEPKMGASGSVLNLFEHKFNHMVEVQGGIMEIECQEIIQKFFTNLREKRR